MKASQIILRVVATILCGPMLLIGVVWILQGLNILPGSFMTGDIKWAVFGAILVLVGGALVYWLNRPRRDLGGL
jgi:hypothetical protein